jgi:hypothetical protein
MEQAEEDCHDDFQDRTARTELQDRSARIGLPAQPASIRQLEENRKEKTFRKGQWDSQNRTARTGQPEQDSQNGAARMGQAEQDCQARNTRQIC